MDGRQAHNLTGVEHQRLKLEDNIDELRKGLRYWQRWDAEYEGFKEELQRLRDEPTGEDLLDSGKEFSSNLLTEPEVKNLVLRRGGSPRQKAEVVKRISDRQGYVQQYVKAFERQLMRELEQLDRLTVNKKATPENTDGGSLTLSEITEQLDDDDNVISSKVSRPGDSAPELISMLEKVGVSDVSAGGEPKPIVQDSRAAPENEGRSKSTLSENCLTAENIGKRNTGKRSNPSAPSELGEPVGKVVEPRAKKSVSFADGVKPPDESRPETREATGQATTTDGQKKSVSFAPVVHVAKPIPAPDSHAESHTSSTNGIAKGSFRPGERVVELDDEERILKSMPVIPDDESPEDAILRREMIEYGLHEVGSVVAELDLEEADLEDVESGDDLPGETDVTDVSDDEDEDQHGRSRQRVLSDEYHKDMQALKARLEARFSDLNEPAAVPNAQQDLPSSNAEPLSASAADPGPTPNPAATTPSSGAKGADEENGAAVSIISDRIFERTAPSRNQVARVGDRLEDASHRQEMSAEDTKSRTKAMASQGDYCLNRSDGGVEGLVMEEGNGRMKKVSRFKAARLAQG